MLPIRPLTLALCLLPLAGCTPVDNSGGEPPAGDAMEFEIVAEPQGFCEAVDAVALLTEQEDIEEWVEGCDSPEDMQSTLEDAHAGLEDGEALVIVSAQLGGCLREFAIAGVFEGADHVDVWMLKEDTSYGKAQVACTDDLGEGHALLVVQDGAEALSAELTVGVWNPELPNGPVSILGEE